MVRLPSKVTNGLALAGGAGAGYGLSRHRGKPGDDSWVPSPFGLVLGTSTAIAVGALGGGALGCLRSVGARDLGISVGAAIAGAGFVSYTVDRNVQSGFRGVKTWPQKPDTARIG